jgi:hypothetical protein
VKAVVVEWRDSVRMIDGWQPLRRYRRKAIPSQRTAGWLIADRKDYIVVALSIGDGTACEAIAIPRGAILSIREEAAR